MGRSINIYSSDAIDEGSFAKFVAEAGGVLGDDDAAFERPDGTVWIYGARAALRGEFESPYCVCAGDRGCDCDPEQERRLDEKLGGRVSVAFYLRLAREPGSAAIALELARHFAERWRAVVECVAYDVFPAEVFDTLLESRRMATALCSELILVLPTVPDFRAPLEESDGLVLDPSDQVGAAKVAKLARYFDIRTETIEGFFYGGGTDVWIVSEQLPETLGARELHERVGTLAMTRLGRRPRVVVRIVTGFGGTPETTQAALAFARRVLASAGGVLVGDFETILSVSELREWVAADYGWRLR